MRRLCIAGLCSFCLASPVHSDIPDASDDCSISVRESTPSEEFKALNDGGSVLQASSDLEWQRCSVGQQWNGEHCEGRATPLNWDEARRKAAEANDWRLPRFNELRGLVERCRTNPAINLAVFPNTPPAFYWASSGVNSERSWRLYFHDGESLWRDSEHLGRARLVRDHD